MSLTVALSSSSSGSLSGSSASSVPSASLSSVYVADVVEEKHVFNPQQIRECGIEVPEFVKALVIHIPFAESSNSKHIFSVAIAAINNQYNRGPLPKEVDLREIINKGIRCFIEMPEQRVDLLKGWQHSRFTHPRMIYVARPSFLIKSIDRFSPFVLDEDELQSFFQLGEPILKGFSKLTIYIPDSRVSTWNRNQERIREELRPIIMAALAARQIGRAYETEMEVHVDASSSLTIRGTTPTSSSTPIIPLPTRVSTSSSSRSLSSSSAPSSEKCIMNTDYMSGFYEYGESIQEVLGKWTEERHEQMRKEFDSLEIDRSPETKQEIDNVKKLVRALVKLAHCKFRKESYPTETLEEIRALNINFSAKNTAGEETFSLASCRQEMERRTMEALERLPARR